MRQGVTAPRTRPTTRTWSRCGSAWSSASWCSARWPTRCSSSASPRARCADNDFTHSTKLEIDLDRRPGRSCWSAMAWPATRKLIAMYDTRNRRDDRQGHRLPVDVEVRVPGRGRGLHQPPGRKSATSMRQSQARAAGPTTPTRNYLLDVDNVAGAAGRHQDPLRDHRRRRHPRLVGARAGLEAGRDPRASSTRPGPTSRRRASTAASAPSCAARTTASCRSSSRPCRRPSTSSWLAAAEGEERAAAPEPAATAVDAMTPRPQASPRPSRRARPSNTPTPERRRAASRADAPRSTPRITRIT